MTKSNLVITQRLRQSRLFKAGKVEPYLAVGLLVGTICIFYAPILAGTATFWGGDLTEFMFPVYTVLAKAIRTLNLSSLIWNPDIFNGFPLLAEGQVGGFYPLAWLFLPWLPSLYALNLTIVLSYLVGALATCWFTRLIGLNWAGSVFAAFVFAFNGFATAHLTHIPIIQGFPWLPIVLCLVELGFRRKNFIYIMLAGLAWGVQWLAGHPQMAFMTMILVAMYAVFRAVAAGVPGASLAKRLFTAFRAIVTVGVVGCAIAAVYLLPLFELGTLSIRPNARLSYDDIVAYSLPFRNLLTAIVPFFFGSARGDYWGMWNPAEMGFYAGVPTVVLAIAGAFSVKSERKPVTLFFAFAALVALVLALGGNTPLYRLLSVLPIFNSLRAPARFVYLLTFCLAVLAGLGLSTLSGGHVSRTRTRLIDALAIAVVFAGIAIPLSSLALHGWLAAQTAVNAHLPGWIVSGTPDPTVATYQGLLRATDPGSVYTYLPGVFMVLSGAFLFLRGRPAATLWQWSGVLLLIVDLGLYTTRMPSSSRYPLEYASVRSPALALVASEPNQYRTYSISTNKPRATMEALRYDGLVDTGGYTPLQLRRDLLLMQVLWGWETYQAQHLLNMMNVRYVVDSVDPSSQGALQRAGNVRFVPSFMMAVVGEQGMAQSLVYNVPATATARVEFVSSYEGSELQGTPEVARLTLIDTTGARHPLSIRGNEQTAYRRATTPAPGDLRVVSAVPLDYAGTVGRSYYTSMTLPSPVTVTSLELDYVAPTGQLRLLGLSLVGDQGQVTELSPYMRDTYQRIYADKNSTVYENKQVLPRAYAVHTVMIVQGEDAALSAVASPQFSPADEVVLEDPRAPVPSRSGGSGASDVRVDGYTPMRVTLHAAMQGDGYLVLSDTNYPGWKADVDGKTVPIYQADYLFRAVYLTKGDHEVTFHYEPTSLWVGSAVSLGSLVITVTEICGVAVWRYRVKRKSHQLHVHG